MWGDQAAAPPEGPFWPDRGDLSSLCGALRRADFTEKAVNDVLEGRNDRIIDLQCALRRTAEASSFHSLLRLFILGVAVDEEAARLALLPANIGCLIDGGLIERTDDGVRATARLAPWRNFFLLSDFLPPQGVSRCSRIS